MAASETTAVPRAGSPERAQPSGVAEGQNTADSFAAPRAPSAGEFDHIERWLDAGLRRGESGRLRAEYPVSFGPAHLACQRVVMQGGRPLAHAMFRLARLHARERILPLGMIGLVYTDPDHRGRGLARGCIDACTRALARQGALLALLWSDKQAFYERLGFAPVGCEELVALDSCWEPAPDLQVGRPGPADLPALERLYGSKPVHLERRPGDLVELLRAPGLEVRVARGASGLRAYAVCGRGDDFGEVVHEWAGDPAGVEACVGALVREAQARIALVGPGLEAASAALRGHSLGVARGCFALGRCLDAARLWKTLACDSSGSAQSPDSEVVLANRGQGGLRLEAAASAASLTHPELLDALFGSPDAPAASRLPGRVSALYPGLPWPLYVWGLDSI